METKDIIKLLKQEKRLLRIVYDYVETIRAAATPVSDDDELYYYSLSVLEGCGKYDSKTGELVW